MLGEQEKEGPRQVEFDRRFLLASRLWLRDEEIKYLTMTPDFQDQDQEEWYAALSGRSDYLIWGIVVGDQPVGAFGLKGIGQRSAEYWGYIGEKRYWGRGIGRWMVHTAVAEAAGRGLESLRLRVRRDNLRAIALYKRMGFRVTEATDEQYWMERGV